MRLLTLMLTAIVIAACGQGSHGSGDPSIPGKELMVFRVTGSLPDDPGAEAWTKARQVVVPLLKQDVAEPRLTNGGPETARLSALSDGKDLAIRIVWADPTREDLVDTDRSTDAVALEFPATGEGGAVPDSMMGEEGKPVSIVLWRYSWQVRLEGGPWGLDALYPNRAVDHYPPEAGPTPGSRAALGKLYDPPRAVGNPLAAAKPASATEDLTAEGFGTLEHDDAQHSAGRGVHQGGRWSVVITRPLDLRPGSKGQLRPGASTYVAVAIWDGGKDQSGSKKMRSIWVPVNFPEARP